MSAERVIRLRAQADVLFELADQLEATIGRAAVLQAGDFADAVRHAGAEASRRAEEARRD